MRHPNFFQEVFDFLFHLHLALIVCEVSIHESNHLGFMGAFCRFSEFALHCFLSVLVYRK